MRPRELGVPEKGRLASQSLPSRSCASQHLAVISQKEGMRPDQVQRQPRVTARLGSVLPAALGPWHREPEPGAVLLWASLSSSTKRTNGTYILGYFENRMRSRMHNLAQSKCS